MPALPLATFAYPFKRNCDLVKGELRRMPERGAHGPAIGYFVCCPVCDFKRNMMLAEQHTIEESPTGIKSLSPPFECGWPSCKVKLSIVDGRWQRAVDGRTDGASA